MDKIADCGFNYSRAYWLPAVAGVLTLLFVYFIIPFIVIHENLKILIFFKINRFSQVFKLSISFFITFLFIP